MPTDNQSRATMHYSSGEKPGSMEVRGQLDWTPVDRIDVAWPVGSVFISVSHSTADAVAAALGGGTWEAIAAGRVLIGIDATQAEYDTAEETGGAETHTHTLSVSLDVDVAVSVDSHPSHNHSNQGTVQAAAGSDVSAWDASNPSTSHGPQGHTAEATVDADGSGSAQASSNVPPYFVVYMWKRTA